MWRWRGLTLLEKIQMVKALIIPKFMSKAELISVSNDLIKEINKKLIYGFIWKGNAGLDVATCGVASATGFGVLATNFSCLVTSLATAISSDHFIYFFSFPKIHDEMNEC